MQRKGITITKMAIDGSNVEVRSFCAGNMIKKYKNSLEMSKIHGKLKSRILPKECSVLPNILHYSFAV